MTTKTEDLTWLNLLRVGAALAVVVLHVSAEPVVFLPVSSSAWQAANIFDSLSRWCIGVFVMVSGALLLDPTRQESTATFYIKRARRILPPIVFWSVAYLILSAKLGATIDAKEVARRLWVGQPAYHMWYLFMIIGLYVVTPLLRRMVFRASVSARWAVALVALMVASAWDLYLAFAQQPLPQAIPAMFIPYLGYYLVGYELRLLAPVKTWRAQLWLTTLVAFAATAIGTHTLVKAHGVTRLGLYMYEYLSPNVIAMSIGVFCLASSVTLLSERSEGFKTRLQGLVTWAAPLTLGIYLWHPMVIEGLRAVGVSPLSTGGVFAVPLVAVSAFSISVILTWGMSKIPGLRWSVGL